MDGEGVGVAVPMSVPMSPCDGPCGLHHRGRGAPGRVAWKRLRCSPACLKCLPLIKNITQANRTSRQTQTGISHSAPTHLQGRR